MSTGQTGDKPGDVPLKFFMFTGFFLSPRESGSRERGVEFKGGSLHDGFGSFDGFGGSGEHLTLLLLVLQNTAQ